MNPVSLSELLDLMPFDKEAQIKTSPRQRFTYVPIPEALTKKFESIGQHVIPSKNPREDIDHITLMYIPKASESVEKYKLNHILKTFRRVAEDIKPIHAKVQGWGYFDGAQKDGKTVTALVGLIDAPGLEDLHVKLKEAAREIGLKPSADHIFTPHVTFAYLKQGDRVQDLPMLDGEFDIDKVMFANMEKHEIPLLGGKSLGEKAGCAIVNGRLI